MIRCVAALSELRERCWAILPGNLTAMAQALKNGTVDASRLSGRTGPRLYLTANGVAVLPIFGVISHRETLFSQIFGGTSTEMFAAALRRALSDPTVGTILFDVDSPGGTGGWSRGIVGPDLSRPG
jgi:ClpP class serine protease